jgi:predicted permease
MTRVGALIARTWTMAVVAIATLVALIFFPANAYENVTQELIALFGLMMAAVLPTMVLTASALRSGNLSVRKIADYHLALQTQMKVWVGLFIISLVASFSVILGKMLDWSVVITFPMEVVAGRSFQLDLIRILTALITACFALVVLRGIAVGKGISSLLRLSGEIALSEAKSRDEARHAAGDLAVGQMRDRPGFGAYVELKQRQA